MSTRGMRILSMLSEKDKMRLGQLEFKQPISITTKGVRVDLKNINVEQLKCSILGKFIENAMILYTFNKICCKIYYFVILKL